ncbi:hypothetical protein Tsubulata_031321 [Turnera subulata]|uniref:R13L1/DRL21-like LRR repeat region domain-containing protein n=1 Tax=Turnera subulata TaxID=218843 RepID=A0A9Q0GHG9_9ROSI|nr:hypothetical protein Tsubulata_031321 [Turnera subulata]
MLVRCRKPFAKLPYDLITSLRCLRSLDLSQLALKELPDAIENLRHLRYLDLSHTFINILPESACKLYNLQVLTLINCRNLVALPDGTTYLSNLRHLNLTGCWRLISMPPHMGNLSSLQRLHRFVVGKRNGCGIGELKEMDELRAILSIDRVGDVLNITEAKKANLNKKQCLHKLELRWGRNLPKGTDEDLLEFLEPHPNLREFTVDVYPGNRFPKWMGKSVLSHLERIELYSCNYSKTLPSLGQLPSLKYLTISMMSELGSIGREFYGGSEIKGFPSLEKLHLESMVNLKEWQEIDHGEFPSLVELVVLNCPSLANLPRLPSLSKLLLDDCHGTILSSVPLLTTLSSLKIANLGRIELLPSGLLKPLSALKELKICNLYWLRALQEELGLKDLSSLRDLEIETCPRLMCLAGTRVPSTLQYLSILACTALKDLPNGLHNLSSLQELSIIKCSVASFPEDKLPSSLKKLIISACANIESLPARLHELPHLEYLAIESCQKLASLPPMGLPPSLDSLSIIRCAMLEERCKEGGEDWPKIAHIPHKWIL